MTTMSARSMPSTSTMIWTHPGMTTYYRNKSGRVFSAMPWRFVDYWAMTHDADLDRYRLTKSAERCSNGHEETNPAVGRLCAPSGTYPADVCVLRYALERHAREPSRTRSSRPSRAASAGPLRKRCSRSKASLAIYTSSASASMTMSC